MLSLLLLLLFLWVLLLNKKVLKIWNPVRIAFAGAFAIALALSSASAGLVNVNLAQFHDTDTGFDGNGPLGGGLWNRINFADAVYSGPTPRPYPACRIQSWGARPLVTSMGGE